MASIDNALKLFDDEKIDAQQLQDFIRANEPPGAPVLFNVQCGTGPNPPNPPNPRPNKSGD